MGSRYREISRNGIAQLSSASKQRPLCSRFSFATLTHWFNETRLFLPGDIRARSSATPVRNSSSMSPFIPPILRFRFHRTKRRNDGTTRGRGSTLPSLCYFLAFYAIPLPAGNTEAESPSCQRTLRRIVLILLFPVQFHPTFKRVPRSR